MKELLTQYSVTDILIFIVILAAAIKGTFSFFEWAHAKLKSFFSKQEAPIKQKEKTEKRFEKNEQAIQEIKTNQEQINATLQQISNKITLLINSDKDDIKSFITREHHYFCYQLHWIDDYSLECCERRYQHYRDEGGNSFILGFMNELRALPKQPPNTNASSNRERKGETK